MPITQVDKDETGAVEQVWARFESGQYKGDWSLKLGGPGDTDYELDSPTWLLEQYELGENWGLMKHVGTWLIREADRNGQIPFADRIGIRTAKAMFRKFGIVEEPRELVLEPNPRPETAADWEFPDRRILRHDSDSWPWFVELIDGNWVKLEHATPEQLSEAAKLQDEIGKAHRELARKLRSLARGEVRLVGTAD